MAVTQVLKGELTDYTDLCDNLPVISSIRSSSLSPAIRGRRRCAYTTPRKWYAAITTSTARVLTTVMAKMSL